MGKKMVEGKDLIAFRENLKKISGGMTQEKLAEIIDVTPQTMSKKLTGNGNGIYLGEALAFAHYFGCTLDDLFGFSGEAPEQKKKNPLTFRDVARMLVAIDEGFHFKSAIGEKISHEIFDPEECLDGFLIDPEFIQKLPVAHLQLEPRYFAYDEYSKGVTDGYIQLNLFLKKYFVWKETLRPDVDEVEWDRHVKIALEKVPADPAPYPLKEDSTDSESQIPDFLQDPKITTAHEDESETTSEQKPSQEKKTAPKKKTKKS